MSIAGCCNANFMQSEVVGYEFVLSVRGLFCNRFHLVVVNAHTGILLSNALGSEIDSAAFR